MTLLVNSTFCFFAMGILCACSIIFADSSDIKCMVVAALAILFLAMAFARDPNKVLSRALSTIEQRITRKRPPKDR